MVAAIFAPIRPLLPMPEMITCPVQPSRSPTAWPQCPASSPAARVAVRRIASASASIASEMKAVSLAFLSVLAFGEPVMR